MGFRLRRSFRLMPGIRLDPGKSAVSTSIGKRGTWFTLGPGGTRATLGVPGTGLSYTEQSPWQRPSAPADAVRGIEVAELPQEEIEIIAAATPARHPSRTLEHDTVHAYDETQADPRLLPIALALAALVATIAVLWALLV